MDQYVTGEMIRNAREALGLSQAKLGELLNISDKTVSKWETGRGYPDISMLESLASALGLSVTELLAGKSVTNGNRSFNMMRMKFYVCPVCGNVIISTGEAVISCCGITLPVCEAEPSDEAHSIHTEIIEDEYFVSIDHEMTKSHYISFIAAVKDDGCEIKKLYPEGPTEARFKISRSRLIYCFCNRHGLFRYKI